MTYKWTIAVGLFIFAIGLSAYHLWNRYVAHTDVKHLESKGAKLKTPLPPVAPESQDKLQLNNQEKKDKPPVTPSKTQPETSEPLNQPKEQPSPENQKDFVEFPGGVRLFQTKGYMEVDGVLCNSYMPLEVYACALGGKDHESVAVLACKPQDIHLGLVLLGLQSKQELGKEGGPTSFGDTTRPIGDRLVILLRWEENGKTVEHRAEDVVIDHLTEKSMPHFGWIFSGSTFYLETDMDTNQPTGRKIYAANRIRTVIATYHDPTAVVDSPVFIDPHIYDYRPNMEILPKGGGKVTLIFRAPSKEEEQEMIKAEEEFQKKNKEQEDTKR